MKGDWQCKHENLKPLYLRARELMGAIVQVLYTELISDFIFSTFIDVDNALIFRLVFLILKLICTILSVELFKVLIV